MTTLTIATRKSPLALWQAEFVKAKLQALHPELTVKLLPMSTKGDRILDSPLAAIGGKGLFVKELEQALLSGEADLAVHSLKDVPAELPEGLALPIQLQREDPSDALVSNRFASLAELPAGAKVGTSSLRRRCQLLATRPDLEILDCRGNVGSRLGKLEAGEYDAIMLASAGLVRLELESRIAERLATSTCLPAIGQGILGLETRIDDADTLRWLAPLHHAESADRAAAERGLNSGLAGGCQAPVAGHALIDGETLTIQGLVGNLSGTVILRDQISGPRSTARQLGLMLAQRLCDAGAIELLAELGVEAGLSVSPEVGSAPAR